MEICKNAIQHKQNISWQEIKINEILDLRKKVGLAIKAGTLPPGNDTFLEKVKIWIRKLFKKK